MKNIIIITISSVFLLCSIFSLSYAKNVQPTLKPGKEILIAKGDKKELEEKIEKLEKKIKGLKGDKEKIEKEIKEQEKELKELKEKKKKKS